MAPTYTGKIIIKIAFFAHLRRTCPFILSLKGQSNEIFSTQLFSSSDQWVKIFSFFGFVFAKIFIFFRSSTQYDTARSQVPHSILMRGIIWPFCILFKGTTVKRDFPPVFFIIRVHVPSPLSNGLNIFKFGLFLPRYSKFSIKNTDSAQYDTAWSKTKFNPETLLQKWKM